MVEHPIYAFDRLIKRQRFLLKLIGIDSYDRQFCFNKLTVMVICLASLFFVISLYDLYLFRNDVFNFVYVLITIFFATIGIARIAVFLCYSNVLAVTLAQTYHTYRLVTEEGEREMSILAWYTKLLQRAVDAYTIMFIGTSIAAGILPLGIYLLNGERVLPYGVVLPFVDHASQKGYELNYLYQVSCIIWTPPGLVASECMIFALVLNICIQYDILAVQLLDLDALIRSHDLTREALISKKLRAILHGQQRLIRYISNIEDSHTVMNGVEVLSLGMQIVITLFVMQFSLWIPGLVVIPAFSLQLFLFCLLGTIIEDKGVKFSDGVYSLTWNELSRENKQIFRLLLLSSQQPKTLTCARMTCISLNLFVNMSQKFYSIFMMLRNM
ncbi:putative odorant receptor 83c [Anopheles maculipalpis]|uniref:putative odorant receptor 83c n=1 Tax=Anopheles maculipalpis TaxID=1496333 RepID=UPI0021596B95|nr:putative odorant receptor 83c [Anopheles maculipalpis]